MPLTNGNEISHSENNASRYYITRFLVILVPTTIFHPPLLCFTSSTVGFSATFFAASQGSHNATKLPLRGKSRELNPTWILISPLIGRIQFCLLTHQ